MGALEELGLVDADVGALAHDRLEERRAPEPTPPSLGEFADVVDRAKGRFARDRRRLGGR